MIGQVRRRRRTVSRVTASRRQLSACALVVVVLAGEVAGRWLARNLPFVGAVPQRAHRGIDLWPVLVALAKLTSALLVARLLWSIVTAQRLARAGERVLGGRRLPVSRPIPVIGLSPRAWLASFVGMSLLALVPTSSGELTGGCWPLLASWVHTQELPVFAVLAVLVAVLWRTVGRWLRALERYGARLRRLAHAGDPEPRLGRLSGAVGLPPRARFGTCLECRPPPAPA